MHKHSYIVDLNLMTYIGKCLQKSVFNVERIYKKILKKLNSSHKLKISNLYIFATRCCRLLIFHTINSAISNSLNLK